MYYTRSERKYNLPRVNVVRSVCVQCTRVYHCDHCRLSICIPIYMFICFSLIKNKKIDLAKTPFGRDRITNSYSI